VVVYFGYAKAHEDDVERAVRGGLAIVDAIGPLNARLAASQVKLSARVGIHTGTVVINHNGDGRTRVFGDTSFIASRVQTAAAPNSVFVTAAVYQLVAGRFIVEDRGARQLKGIDGAVHLYEVVRPSVVSKRQHGPAGHAHTPFVGREDEMRLLIGRWERAREGEGQLVTIVGEPGIGKSRLVREFRDRIKTDAHLWIESAGEQRFENTPFHAVIQMLDQGLGWRGDEGPDERLRQLERSLEVAGLELAEAVPLIAEMLSLSEVRRYPPLMLPADQRRRRLLASLVGWVFGATRMQPLVVATEDLQWVDPSTLELIAMLVEQSATPRSCCCTQLGRISGYRGRCGRITPRLHSIV
jgi:ABC-type transport system involved in cytochrome c biogenesis ATPase subunit